MKLETAHFFHKAREDLADARAIVAIGLGKVAARSAYYAAFHAAEAFIFERTEKIAKTHAGVHKEFARLRHIEAGFEDVDSTVLSRAYRYKTVSDYETSPAIVVGIDEAARAIAEATDFVDAIESLLTSGL